ncbi:hypothetical protein Slin15195_G039410 [Septoria linicola]|uniref:Heterokaryon incompatibility domain-containing protein n=1 Tax=Septoria linicola TaxID=215465 RepID=A0A9Q9AR99_9PEZI|nr:hypothetical protein Slin15195_G039410 [Septoria linicola]
MEQSANHHIADRIYSNLDVSKKQHRLIRFVGGGRDLAWELGTFSCTRPQPLTALSYCWGKAHADRQITLNGHIFLVRPNLHGFLKALENPKAAQGQKLSTEEQRLLDSLQEMTWQLAASSDYWSRLWIVQEILLAKRLVIRWSPLTFEWSRIVSLRIKDVDIPPIELDSHGRPLRPHQLTTIRKAGLFQYAHMPNSAENLITCKQLWHFADSAGKDIHYDMPIMDLYTSALYNYLLSLWAMRPPDDGISYETLRDWDMLEKLGLDYSKLQALGETFMHAFQIKPFHELVFLVTYHVCRQFSAEAALLMVQGLASNWLFHTEYTKLETGSAEDLVKRKWYESEDRAVKRFNKDLMARTDSAMKLLEKVQRANRMLAAPLWESPAKALVSDGRSKPCLDWITSTDAICDEILTRWTARLH